MEKKKRYTRVEWKQRTKKLEGQTFGRLFVESFSKRQEETGRALWNCVCECGVKKEIVGTHLTTSMVKSCGCLRRESKTNPAFMHGDTDKPLWRMWKAMKERCDSKNHISFKNYGARGIKYCIEWKDYLNFKNDMEKHYNFARKSFGKNIKLSIERMDPDGNYCKDNCTIIPLSLQNKNTRLTNRLFTAIDPNGIEQKVSNQSEFAKDNGLIRSCIGKCLGGQQNSHRGWSFKWYKDKPKRIKLKRS